MATKKTPYEAPAPASDKKKALQTALSQLDKAYGKGTVMRLGDRPEMNVEAIPTGSLALDAALGIGGVPRGAEVSLRSMAPNPRVKPLWPCTFWQKPRSGAVKWPSWTPSTHLTPSMRRPWG